MEANRGEFYRFFELPRNMTNPMEAIARTAMIIKSDMNLVFNHTPALLSNQILGTI